MKASLASSRLSPGLKLLLALVLSTVALNMAAGDSSHGIEGSDDFGKEKYHENFDGDAAAKRVSLSSGDEQIEGFLIRPSGQAGPTRQRFARTASLFGNDRIARIDNLWTNHRMARLSNLLGYNKYERPGIFWARNEGPGNLSSYKSNLATIGKNQMSELVKSRGELQVDPLIYNQWPGRKIAIGRYKKSLGDIQRLDEHGMLHSGLLYDQHLLEGRRADGTQKLERTPASYRIPLQNNRNNKKSSSDVNRLPSAQSALGSLGVNGWKFKKEKASNRMMMNKERKQRRDQVAKTERPISPPDQGKQRKQEYHSKDKKQKSLGAGEDISLNHVSRQMFQDKRDPYNPCYFNAVACYGR
ncbi:hypothetical protein PoB_003225600 [Plakobranchus ocellatus]|uniref:Uncharacterized protein n=1 Tax=Plakobranchus ocellatus TaxID=259542 RepID=A0AAV4ABN1_9GAST|nr:hypothetical protein PoB_003225600 [Plakobranchus ocellatus]